MTTINREMLKKASAATINWPVNCGGRTEIMFDTETGDVWTKDYASADSYTRYNDPAVIIVCSTTRHMSEKAIRKAIEDAIELRKAI